MYGTKIETDVENRLRTRERNKKEQIVKFIGKGEKRGEWGCLEKWDEKLRRYIL